MNNLYKKLCQYLPHRRTVLRRFVLPLVLYAAVIACVTPYQPDTKSLPQKLLIVDGYITDQLGPHQVSLSYSSDYTNAALYYRAAGATVYVSDETGQRQSFTEVSPGIYRTPATFKGVAGKTYKLSIVLADGRQYESVPEKIRPAPVIDRIYDEYTQKPIPNTLNFDKEFNVYIDTKDPATPGDYYRWKWTNFDLLQYCLTREVQMGGQSVTYGYSCCQTCWDIHTCTGANCLNATSDEAINGNAISHQLIVRVPFTSFVKYYLEIEQLSISREAYTYFKTIENLTANNGGIFDSAPATVHGNMRSLTNPSEMVFGYFGASGAQKVPYLVDRSRGEGSPNSPPMIQVPPGPPPPCSTCVESDYRTRIQPRWWTF